MKLGVKSVLLSFVLAGCGSTEPKLYTLQRVEGPVESMGPATVEVGRPGLAGYLNRPEIVLKDNSYRISTNDQHRWAEPLDDMIGRVLTQNLSQRLKNSSVYDQGGAITATPDARVEVDIVSLNEDDTGNVSLGAQVAVEQGATHRALAARHVSLQQTADGNEPAALVAAMSNLLGQLSDRIASDVHSSTVATAAAPQIAAASPPAAPVAASAPAAQNVPVADAKPGPTEASKDVAVASNTTSAVGIPIAVASTPAAIPVLAVAPAPLPPVAAAPLAPACESGGRAVPCLQVP